MKIRTLIADNDAASRRRLLHLLEEETWLECVGETEGGPATVEAINELRPELVFLDVQLPGFLGTEVIKKISCDPHVVFTTSNTDYAHTAFELHALDYLLKPVRRDRLQDALEHARWALEHPRSKSSLSKANNVLGERPKTRLFVRRGGAIIPVPVDDIHYLQADRDYVEVHTKASTYTVHATMQELESRLDGHNFVRIHRSYIVNLDRVVALRPHDSSRLQVELTDGTKLVASRSRSQELRSLTL